MSVKAKHIYINLTLWKAQLVQGLKIQCIKINLGNYTEKKDFLSIVALWLAGALLGVSEGSVSRSHFQLKETTSGQFTWCNNNPETCNIQNCANLEIWSVKWKSWHRKSTISSTSKSLPACEACSV